MNRPPRPNPARIEPPPGPPSGQLAGPSDSGLQITFTCGGPADSRAVADLNDLPIRYTAEINPTGHVTVRCGPGCTSQDVLDMSAAIAGHHLTAGHHPDRRP